MIALFDLDGVVLDSETQYSVFWCGIGREYLGQEDFGHKIKGQTLTQIMNTLFGGETETAARVVARLNEYEANMSYEYIPGAYEFILGLKERGVPMAIVTSSNAIKMEAVRKVRPELWELMDAVLTSEHFSKSKPDPECFLKGMEILGGKPSETYVFEDSIHGLNAGRASGACVVGLATTNSREVVGPLSDIMIDDFIGFSI